MNANGLAGAKSAGENVHLFQQMETERAKIPHILRDDYLPVFVVKCLRERLAHDESCREDEDLVKMRGSKQLANPFAKFSTEDSMWTDDTLLEENPDFEGVFLLSKEDLNYVGKVLRFAKDALEGFLLSRNKIGRYFTDEFEFPCLELLYLMDSFYNILPLNSYLLWLKQPSQINYFKQQFLAFAFSHLAFSGDNCDRSNKILQRFLQCLILAHYCNPCSKPSLQKLKDNSGEILRLITAKLICEDNTRSSTMNHIMILTVLKDVDIPNTVRIKYLSEHIRVILQSGKKPFLAGTDILQFQEQYADPTKLIDSETLTLTISHMLLVLRSNDIFEIVSSTLTTSDFNWEMLLFLISVWVQEKQNSTTLLKDLCKTLIQNGLISKRENDLMKGFIIARHCSVIASELFSRYEKWFTNMFNSEIYSVAKEPESFKFLIEILTQWIPVEPSCFLHVHTTFWPFVPKGCRELWNDYLSTAKARISEYKEVEEAMEFEPNPNDPIQHEVAIAIKNFESRGKIPVSIIKMSIFSKPHYINSFLPALLRKPANVSLTDSRLRLIELLKREGKIPDEMYTTYKANVKAS